MIRDRIDYTVQNLEIARYEHMFVFVLKYKTFCLREDVFAIMCLIEEAETEEDYLKLLKRFIMFTKLVAAPIIQLYEINNILDAARGLAGRAYYLVLDIPKTVGEQMQLEKECREYE